MLFRYIFLLLFVSNVFSQEKGLVYYGFIDAIGIGNSKGPDYNSYLLFNKEQSYYVTCKDSLENVIEKEAQKTYENEEGGGAIYNGLKVSEKGDQVVYHIEKNTMWSNFLYEKQIYVKEVAPKIDWKIGKETKKIGVFNCKRATANFRGRNYTAWFTTEIPLPFGPWKFQGLPGLILEVYDTNKNVHWYFKTIEYPSKSNEKLKYISKPVKEKLNSYSEYKLLQKKIKEKATDKNKLISKQFPGVTFIDPEIKQMFIECEE
ncbi:GLPGLI family protein [Flavobacterium haoranii]|uniref:GLPGLI family protein n=2 Tax=Flavobacterium haoranii TaxID=683124 RepID=A0A1M6EA77_9FLAO|nr:GLPGLI family protein [Flavobacterium haoranii]SHI82323.1 GLPGLI family protein [Flavobacterium haoranii]